MLPEIIRCPYCVSGGSFRPMIKRSADSFLCLGCGHTTTPDDPYAKCACARCYEMNQAANRRRNFDEMRRYAAEGDSSAVPVHSEATRC